MEHQITPGLMCRRGAGFDLPGQCPHRDVVRQQQSGKPKLFAQIRHADFGKRYGPFRIDFRKDNVSRHRHWQVREFAKRQEVGFKEFSKRCVDARQGLMTVARRASVAGRMLKDRKAARIRQADGQRTRHDRHHGSGGTEATIPEEGMSFGPGNVCAWGAVHVYPVREKLGANQEPAQIHCPFGLGRHTILPASASTWSRGGIHSRQWGARIR